MNRSGTARTALFFLAAVLLLAQPLGANGGTVRISSEPVGPYFVTVYSSPTPLRTGELDVSVLVQDSTQRVLTPVVVVDARPLSLEEGITAEPIRRTADRAQATNKLFQAAKFDVEAPGEWEFRITIAEAGDLSFRATVAQSTILDRPYLLALLLFLPLALVGWLFLGRNEDDEPSAQSRMAATT